MPFHLDDGTLKRRHNRITNALARQLERLGALEEALSVYEQAEHPPARERRSRILVKQNKSAQALQICEEILVNPWNEEEAEFAESFGSRLKKKEGLLISSTPAIPVQEEVVVLPLSEARGMSVELHVAHHLTLEGSYAHYLENHLWTGLFGLAFWDIVFMPMRGAFFNLFQRGPRDLNTPDFRRRRHEVIVQRLTTIEQDPLWPETVLKRFAEKQGIANPLVHWSALDLALIQQALERIPRRHLVKIFDRMSYDLQNNRTGFPDLVVFSEEHYELVEVKAPGDRLQNNQVRWIKYFNVYGVPYRVIHVRYE